MKFKHLLMSGLIMALAGLFVVGCNENPDDPNDPDPTTVAPPTGLMAVSMDGAVMLKWTASADADTYVVTWDDGTTELSTEDITDTEYKVEGLTNGTAYAFSVVAVDANGDESSAASITWAPAERLTTDTDPGSAVLRIYEKAAPATSGKGSGLIIDPAKGGPSNESVATGNLANIQLAADVQGNKIIIGPASAPEFSGVFTNWSQFDKNVQVSDTFAVTSGLDAWYQSSKLGDLFGDSRKNAYEIANQQAGNQGIGFAFRLGSAGNYKYGRAFIVPGTNGQLVQNDGHNYIVLQISFQTVQGVPYAK